MSTPLTFKELQEGAKFICFPIDGDDSGHGGYRQGSYLFTKLKLYKGDKVGEVNAMRNDTGVLLSFYPDEQVILVL